MKKVLFLMAFALISMCMQAVISTAVVGHVHGTIVDGLTVVETQQMNFGSIDAGMDPGTVTISYDGLRSVTGGALEVGTGFSSGSFTITSTPGLAVGYVIQATPVTMLGQNTGLPLTVSDFVGSVASGTTNEGGTAVLKVGATATILVNQAADIYNGTFNVTVTHD